MTIVSDPSTAHAYTSTNSATVGGTVRWMAPELLYPEHFGLEHTNPTRSSDIYALGMVILEVCPGPHFLRKFIAKKASVTRF
jgi:serine/threonine protein kinase